MKRSKTPTPPGTPCAQCGQPHERALKSGETRALCAAHRKGSDPLAPCQKTPRPGFRVCGSHGAGYAKREASGERAPVAMGNAKHALYARLKDRVVAEEVTALVESDATPADLRHELATARVLFTRIIDALAAGGFTDLDLHEIASGHVGSIAKLADVHQKAELARATTYTRAAVDQMRDAMLVAIDRVLRARFGPTGEQVAAEIATEFARILEGAPPRGGAHAG